jgi:hypothetical protein
MSREEKHELAQVLHELRHLKQQQEQTMSVLSDLQASVASLQTASANETSAVLAAIADINSLPASDAALVPLTSAITAVAASTQANADALNKAVGAVTGPPATIPVITTQPQSFTGSIAAGNTSASLSVVTPDPKPSFQWFTGDPTPGAPAPVAIPGATSATFNTPIQTSPSVTPYFCAVSNSTGTNNSAAAVVTITA